MRLLRRIWAWWNDPTDIRIPREYRALAEELAEARKPSIDCLTVAARPGAPLAVGMQLEYEGERYELTQVFEYAKGGKVGTAVPARVAKEIAQVAQSQH